MAGALKAVDEVREIVARSETLKATWDCGEFQD